MKNFVSIILKLLLRPVVEQFRLLCLLCLLVIPADFITRIITYNIYFALYYAFLGLVLCYFSVFVYSLFIGTILKNILKIIILTIAVITNIIDVSCLYLMPGSSFSEFIGVVQGTNGNEIQEFIEVFISYKLLFILIINIAFCFTIVNFVRSCSIIFSKIIIYTVIIISVITTIKDTWYYLEDIYIGRVIKMCKIESPPDLKSNKTYPQLKRNASTFPKNVVLILGESLSKSHCSLYSYDKVTQPQLQQLVNNDDLFIFENVKSVASHTIQNFQSIFSTYRQAYGDKIKWYECITLQEILKKIGYKTFWISNQSKNGLWDNIPTKYAECCDSVIFVGSKFQGMNLQYDENVLEALHGCKDLFLTNCCNFIIIHLMGSHEAFNARYPSSFEVFKENDYTNFPIEQRLIRSQYDNTVIYNDYVINEIIKLFSLDESLIFYFPDHGLDIYVSNNNYYGHAIPHNEKSVDASLHIPFLIYTSSIFKENFPDVLNDINKSLNKQFCTENMIYTIMDVLDVEFVDNNDVEHYSLFKN